MKTSKFLIALGAISLLGASPVLAQQSADVPRSNTSAITSINLDQCHFITNEELGLAPLSEEEAGMGSAAWLCIGYDQSIIYVAEGDLRMFVSFGANAMQERAASQTLPEFNTMGDTIEWRLRTTQNTANATPVQTPFATIHSLHTETGERAEIKGEVLVVTKLEPGNTCHVAYVDVNMPVLSGQSYDPHQIARDIADNLAKDFNCATDDTMMVPS